MKELIACLAPNRRVEVEVKGEGGQALSARPASKKPRLARGFFFAARPSARIRGYRLADLPMQTVDLRIDAALDRARRARRRARRPRADRRRRAHRRRRAARRTPTRLTRAREHVALPRARADARASSTRTRTRR